MATPVKSCASTVSVWPAASGQGPVRVSVSLGFDDQETLADGPSVPPRTSEPVVIARENWTTIDVPAAIDEPEAGVTDVTVGGDSTSQLRLSVTGLPARSVAVTLIVLPVPTGQGPVSFNLSLVNVAVDQLGVADPASSPVMESEPGTMLSVNVITMSP